MRDLHATMAEVSASMAEIERAAAAEVAAELAERERARLAAEAAHRPAPDTL